eukprot:3989918-Lingulodinium_polyedra.AAC.1
MRAAVRRARTPKQRVQAERGWRNTRRTELRKAVPRRPRATRRRRGRGRRRRPRRRRPKQSPGMGRRRGRQAQAAARA